MSDNLTDSNVKLNEYDKDEWFSIMKKLNPSLTHEEYETQWDEFQEEKRKRGLQ